LLFIKFAFGSVVRERGAAKAVARALAVIVDLAVPGIVVSVVLG
jgi:acetyl-CoA carboxylase alpha subunit